MTVRTLHDSSLKILNALVERGEALKLDTLLSGFIMFFALGVTSTALLFSGALFFIGIIIIIPLIAVSILSFFSTPVEKKDNIDTAIRGIIFFLYTCCYVWYC